MTPVYVYALLDGPVGAIRYVGTSSNPEARIRSHCSPSAAKPIQKWIATLGTTPTWRVLEACPDDAAAQIAEQAWIQRLRSRGEQLLNGFCRPRVLRSVARAPRFTGFGWRCVSRRKELGLSQRAVSALSGVGSSELSRIESGQRPNVTVDTAVRIARALRTTVEWLATGEDAVRTEAAG